MNITITDINKTTVLVIPIVPPKLIMKSGANNEVFSSINKDINIIGNPTLNEFTINSIFPVGKSYPFVANGAEKNGYRYCSFIEENKNNKLPIRVVITTQDKYTILNTLMSIESFTFSINKNSDIEYELALKEFPTL